MTGQRILKKALPCEKKADIWKRLTPIPRQSRRGSKTQMPTISRADTYALLGLYREAIQDYDRAIDLGVEDQELFIDRAYSLCCIADYERPSGRAIGP